MADSKLNQRTQKVLKKVQPKSNQGGTRPGSGRKKGSGQAAHYRDMLAPHAEALIKQVVDLAKSGDMAALKLCFDRLCAPLRATDRLITIEGMSTAKELSSLAGQEVNQTTLSSKFNTLTGNYYLQTKVKIKHVAAALTLRPLARFEAKDYRRHCLNCVVFTLRNKLNITIDGKCKTEPDYHGVPILVVRGSVSPDNLEASLTIIERKR